MIDPEIYEECEEWIYLVTSFLGSIDLKTGSYLHFPFDGGYFDQPYVTMTLWEECRQEYFLALKEANK